MRKKKHEEYTNHEAWAIPYADLVTLLLAFFVVMYAVSVVNEGKYRVASESMSKAFNGGKRAPAPQVSDRTSVPLPVPAPKPATVQPASANAPSLAPVNVAVSQQPAPSPAASVAPPAQAATNLQLIEDQVRKALQPLVNRQMVAVRRGPNALEIEIRTDVLFPSGVAQLSAPADGVLSNIAAILAPFDNSLRVEGFTDNVPIATPTYPSNWELSAARAATVARLFAEHGVSPDRLGIVGWGEVRPIADNASPEGRNRNRRVLVVVMGEQDLHGRAVPNVDKLQAALPSAAVAPALGPTPSATPLPSAAVAPELGPTPGVTPPVPGVTVVSSVQRTTDPAPDVSHVNDAPAR